MSAIITEIIPPQPVEIIENRIGEILVTEIANQQNLQFLTENVGVFLERIEPFEKSEDVGILLTLYDGDYSEFTQQSSQGSYMYYIDLYCTGEGNSTETASINSKNKIQKYVGMIRYILSSGKYPTLGFPYGLIGNKHIKKILYDVNYSNFGNHSNYDGSYVRFCRMILMVNCIENQDLWLGIPLQGNDTNITYENTSKGIQLIFNK